MPAVLVTARHMNHINWRFLADVHKAISFQTVDQIINGIIQ